MMVFASAPLRILDIGSWTDAAFAEHGAALNCAIARYARVCVTAREKAGVELHLHSVACGPQFQLIGDAFRALARHFALDGIAVWARADLPPGTGVGATASVVVALTAALAHYAAANLSPVQLALLAHQIVSEEVGRVCGTHSHLAAALGGVGLYRTAPYPRVFTTPLADSPEWLREIEERLLLVDSGRPAAGNCYAAVEKRCRAGETLPRRVLWQLRKLPTRAADALRAHDYATLGAVMRDQATLQRQVCPALHTPEARRIAAIADAHQAVAKVNGTGGSLTLLTPPEKRQALIDALQLTGYSVSPVVIAPEGVKVWTE